MTQPAPSDTPLDTSAPKNDAWGCLLALETQVQTTQAFLTLYTTKLARLHQATDTISHSLQALLECLPLTPTLLQTPPVRAATPPVPCFGASLPVHANIPCPALPDTFNGDQAIGEHFLQSCITYI